MKKRTPSTPSAIAAAAATAMADTRPCQRRRRRSPIADASAAIAFSRLSADGGATAPPRAAARIRAASVAYRVSPTAPPPLVQQLAQLGIGRHQRVQLAAAARQPRLRGGHAGAGDAGDLAQVVAAHLVEHEGPG